MFSIINVTIRLFEEIVMCGLRDKCSTSAPSTIIVVNLNNHRIIKADRDEPSSSCIKLLALHRREVLLWWKLSDADVSAPLEN